MVFFNGFLRVLLLFSIFPVQWIHNYVYTIHNYAYMIHNYVYMIHNYAYTIHNYVYTIHNYVYTILILEALFSVLRTKINRDL